MKIWHLIKLILYITLGTLVFIFNEFCLENVGYVVATLMILYATEDIVLSIIDGILKEETKVFSALIEIVLAIVMAVLPKDAFTSKLIMWAVWSITRESKEITECVLRFKEKKFAFLNLAESLIITYFSVTMILNPTEHHAHTHVFLLGVELYTNVLFYYFYGFLDKKFSHEEKDNNEVKES